MASRTKRAQIAQQTVDILKRGNYSLPDGTVVSIANQLKATCGGTVHYTPDDLDEILARPESSRGDFDTHFHVENCTTFAAAKQLVDADSSLDPLCLNFASAKHPGGGFLGGSQAQEESLARESGLYACIAPVRGYYDANHHCGTALYTHHMIYSPRVPVFRDDDDRLLDSPYLVSIVTAPAVNAGAVRQNEPSDSRLVEPTMRERIERVLALAVHHGHDTLVLGAWGCGVFKNDAADVAKWFHMNLAEKGRFHRAFRKVVFAVFDRSKNEETYSAFARQFADIMDN